MRVKIFCMLFLILLAINALADDGPLRIWNGQCEKDGSIKITFDSLSTDKVYQSTYCQLF